MLPTLSLEAALLILFADQSNHFKSTAPHSHEDKFISYAVYTFYGYSASLLTG
jgi:hypothetical protein